MSVKFWSLPLLAIALMGRTSQKTHCGHSLARPLPARAPKRELSQSRI